MLKNLTITLTMMVALLLAIGCSENPVDEPSSENLLDATFGAYTTANESPAFNDPELVVEDASDVEYNDPILISPSMDTMLSDSEAGLYHFRMVWGQLCYDSTVTAPTSWDGSLTISRGGIVLKRLIRWELNQDFIIPRTERTLLEWQSTTTVHNDGLAVDLIVPPVHPIFDTTYVSETDSLGNSYDVMVIDTVYPEVEPVTVMFETGPYSQTFTLDEIAMLDTIVYLDDSNAVAFHGVKAQRNTCRGGFLAGGWGVDDEGNGVFRGKWINFNGNIDGFVKGNWGVNSEGQNVFVGKWIDRSGEFEGFVRGTFRACDNLSSGNGDMDGLRKCLGGGLFYGRIFNADREVIGQLKGKFGHSEGRGAFFAGKWRLNCSDRFGTDIDWDAYDFSELEDATL